MPFTVAETSLKLQHFKRALKHTVVVLCLNILTTMSSKGILSESRRKIGNWLFNTRLTSSTYVHLHINKSAFESQINMMKLSLNAKKLLVPSYLFVRTSSFLLRLSSSVLDSTADLTFDPVSARFSTGTQPRSVIQQNQNNMALHSGYESKLYPVYAL